MLTKLLLCYIYLGALGPAHVYSLVGGPVIVSPMGQGKLSL